MKVLFIDDSRDRQEEISTLFSKVYPDWNVTYAWNDIEALNAFKLHEFDLVFFDHDLGLNSENGSWIAYQVLNNPEKYRVPKKVWIHSNNFQGAKNIYAKFNSVEVWCYIQPFDSDLVYKISRREEFVGFCLELEDHRHHHL